MNALTTRFVLSASYSSCEADGAQTGDLMLSAGEDGFQENLNPNR